MLTAAKEGTFSASSDPCALFPLAAAEVYPKTRVWGSKPESVHCSSATAPLKIELRWGCGESSEKTAVGSGVSFKYDPFGRRIYKSSSSSTSVYAYDHDNLIEETNGAGAVGARYAQDRRLDEPLAVLRSGTTSYYEADGLGSVTSLSNSVGALAQTYTFDSFGNQTASSGSLTNSLRYTGREFDTETNLYFYRARYFDPQAGRFVSEDSMGPNEGPNLYGYVSNNPVTNADPSGHFKIDQSCKGRCQAFGGGGSNNSSNQPPLQNLEQVIQQQTDLACSNLQGITNPKLRACIQKSCDKGTIKCKGNGDKGCHDAGGYNNKIPLIGNRTANLCPDNWGPGTSPSYVGDAVVHEFAHGCGWNDGQGGGVPNDPVKPR
jgi:RHS repeat-associated protein